MPFRWLIATYSCCRMAVSASTLLWEWADYTKAAYPWMNALEAKAALGKAVSGYKHEATH
jgi:hypothetical protein